MFNLTAPHMVPDMEQKILYHLNAQELARSSQVSKIWYEKSSSNNSWSKFFPKLTLKKELFIKQYFNCYGITSLNQLIHKVAQFNQKLGSLNGELHCHFPTGSKCLFALQINKNPTTRKIKEHYWFFETFPLQNANKDFIIISPQHHYTLHVRLPKDPKLNGFTHQITSLISG